MAAVNCETPQDLKVEVVYKPDECTSKSKGEEELIGVKVPLVKIPFSLLKAVIC